MLDAITRLTTKQIILLLGAAALFVYAWSLPNGFVWDDEEQVVNNPAVHQLSNIPEYFSGSTFHTGGAGGSSGIYYKPLMTTSFAILHSLGGGRPWIFHLFQAVMHAANSALVFLILRKLFGRWLMPAVLALVFALHPLNVESVVYVSALQDAQFFFFGALALLAVMYRERFNFIYGQAIPGSLLLASMLSKETGVVVLAIYALYVIIFGRLEKFTKRDYYWQAGNILGSLGVYIFMRLVVAKVEVGTQGLSPITTATTWERFLSVPQIVFYYLSNFVLPYKLAIAQHWIVRSAGWQEFWLPLSVLMFALLLMGLIVLKSYQKSKQMFLLALFFLLWFWGAILLHLHVVPLDMTVADRWFYLPMVGLLGLIGIGWQLWGAGKISTRSNRQLLLAVLIVTMTALSVRSIVRIRDWRDGLTLFSHDIAYSQDAFDLENNLGTELMRAGRADEAKPHFERSTELLPHWWTSWNNLGVVYAQEGNIELAKEYYARAIENGQYFLAYQNMASLLYREEGAGAANEFVTESLELLPYNFQLNYIKAISEYELGNRAEAIRYAQRVFQISPSIETRSFLEQVTNGTLELN